MGGNVHLLSDLEKRESGKNNIVNSRRIKYRRDYNDEDFEK